MTFFQRKEKNEREDNMMKSLKKMEDFDTFYDRDDVKIIKPITLCVRF